MACTVVAVRPDCPLCDDALAILDDLAHPYVTRAARPDELVPVVEVDGVEVSVGIPRRLAISRALKRAARGR